MSLNFIFFGCWKWTFSGQTFNENISNLSLLISFKSHFKFFKQFLTWQPIFEKFKVVRQFSAQNLDHGRNIEVKMCRFTFISVASVDVSLSDQIIAKSLKAFHSKILYTWCVLFWNMHDMWDLIFTDRIEWKLFFWNCIFSQWLYSWKYLKIALVAG